MISKLKLTSQEKRAYGCSTPTKLQARKQFESTSGSSNQPTHQNQLKPTQEPPAKNQPLRPRRRTNPKPSKSPAKTQTNHKNPNQPQKPKATTNKNKTKKNKNKPTANLTSPLHPLLQQLKFLH